RIHRNHQRPPSNGSIERAQSTSPNFTLSRKRASDRALASLGNDPETRSHTFLNRMNAGHESCPEASLAGGLHRAQFCVTLDPIFTAGSMRRGESGLWSAQQEHRSHTASKDP